MAKKIDPSVEHPDYPELERKYDLTEDAFEGDVCEFVPKLVNQSQKEYEAYVSRAAYFNMVERTVTALTGALTRKPYVLTGYDTFPENEYGDGTTFIQACYRDILLGSRVSLLVDVCEDGSSCIIPYDADDVINWYGDGTNIGDFIMIEEETLVRDPQNPYSQIEVCTYRELYIDESGFYAVRVWSQTQKNIWISKDLPPMLVNGNRINYIPLWFVTQFDNTCEVYNPPLFTQASLNIQHFRQATDLAHYAHFMALPTFTIVGDLFTYTDDTGNQTQAQIKMGSTQEALHLTQGSSAQYTEVSGASFAMLQTEMKATEDRIFIAGSRLLSSKKGIESAEALQLRSGSESAVLDTMVHAFSSALNAVLELCGQIDNVPNASIELNTDFTAATLDPAVTKSLLELYTAGTITLDQLLGQLYAGEVVAPPTV
jgi:hypothetical protein